MAARIPKPRVRRTPWDRFDDEQLLDLRFCDLALEWEGTTLESHVQQVWDELALRDIRVRPHIWLSTEWFSPDGIPGVAVPFYLAHPRLLRLEKTMMLEAEGGTREDCLGILRHEFGHCVQHAWRLHRRGEWRRQFGNTHKPYPEIYRPNPASQRFVQHLRQYYAQAHPDEDFAETFAVWLTPRSAWRRRYAGWPALRKLEYVDGLMAQVAARAPRLRSRREVEPVEHSRRTLAEHYRGKAGRYVLEDGRYDRSLCRIFSRRSTRPKDAAASYLRSIRPQMERLLVRRARLHHYVVEHVLDVLIHRCSHMHLHLRHDRRSARRQFLALAQRVVLGILKRNRENYAL